MRDIEKRGVLNVSQLDKHSKGMDSERATLSEIFRWKDSCTHSTLHFKSNKLLYPATTCSNRIEALSLEIQVAIG
jgi:hypothetical protein